MASATQVRYSRHEKSLENSRCLPCYQVPPAMPEDLVKAILQKGVQRGTHRKHGEVRTVQVHGHLCHNLCFFSKHCPGTHRFPAQRPQLAAGAGGGKQGDTEMTAVGCWRLELGRECSSPKNVNNISSLPALAPRRRQEQNIPCRECKPKRVNSERVKAVCPGEDSSGHASSPSVLQSFCHPVPHSQILRPPRRQAV